jgi:CBS domain-containing protein
MRVQAVMKKSPKVCNPSTNLAAAAEVLWSCGCGALPVVDGSGRVVGIITDRDICVAVGTRDRRPSQLIAEQAMSRQVATCRTGDDIHVALKIMRTRKVHRLPVLNEVGKLEGILCVSDLVVDARHDDGSRPELSYEDIMNTLRGIYWHHSLEVASTR